MSDQYLGEIRAFGFGFAPEGWAICNGQLLDIAQNTALFSLLGTRFGGNGRTTFGVPNLQGRVPMHAGSGPGLTPRLLAQFGGQEAVTLTEAQNPSHTHGVNCDNDQSDEANVPSGRFISTNMSNKLYKQAAQTDIFMNSQFVAPTGGQPHENRQPFLVMNYYIALEGIFPPRS